MKLDLQLQAFAARDIARGFLGHSYQLRFSKLGNTNCYLKFFVLNAFYISNAIFSLLKFLQLSMLSSLKVKF